MSTEQTLHDAARQVERRVERLHAAGIAGADLDAQLALLEDQADQPGVRERVTGAFLAHVWESIAWVLRAEMTAGA